MPDDTVEIPVEGEGECVMPATAEENVMQTVLSGMARAEAAAADVRIRAFDQLAVGTSAMWTQYLASPSITAAMGFRVAQQSGGYPAKSGTGTDGN